LKPPDYKPQKITLTFITKPESSDLLCRMLLSAQVKIKNLREPNYNNALTKKSDVQQVSEIWSEETATHFSTPHADQGLH
jgi:hypothetical protein